MAMLTITPLAALFLRESPDDDEAMELADEGEAEVASQEEHEGFFRRLWDGFVNMLADVSEGKEVALPQGEAPPTETRPGAWGMVGVGVVVLGLVVVAVRAAARRRVGAQLLPQEPRLEGEYPEAEYVRMEE